MALQTGNILLVANYQSDVGYAWWLMENFWSTIARRYSGLQCKCYLIFPKVNEIPVALAESPLEVAEIDFGDRTKSGINKLKQFIRERKIKIVYLTDRPFYDFIYFRLRVWGVRKIINHIHRAGGDARPQLAVRLVKKIIHRSYALSCDCYIAVSNFVQSRLIFNACIPAGRCAAVMNGIQPINIEQRYQHYAHEQFKVPVGAKIIITTGRASFYKGVDFFIECANVLIHKYSRKDIYFVFCGTGPDIEVFREQANRLNLGPQFIFAGHRKDVRFLLQSCDIAVHASYCEAFSLSVLEYLSAGLVTLAPAICGNVEAIENNVTGFLYPSRDLDALIQLLLRVLDNEELRNRISAAASSSVRNTFNITRTNTDLVRTLETVLS
jgi:glycosyltransferase involved in cell wall biosynthesis